MVPSLNISLLQQDKGRQAGRPAGLGTLAFRYFQVTKVAYFFQSINRKRYSLIVYIYDQAPKYIWLCRVVLGLLHGLSHLRPSGSIGCMSAAINVANVTLSLNAR